MSAEWQPWFAWYPVEVEAYDVIEIVGGKMRYWRSMCWVERRWKEAWTDEEEDHPGVWEYRPARRL